MAYLCTSRAGWLAAEDCFRKCQIFGIESNGADLECKVERAMEIRPFNCGSSGVEKYASTHHGAQQGEAARRSSDMRQARHLPQRWYWSIVLQVRDVIRQFTQGTDPNCNTNPKATVFGIPKEPVLESAELITSRLTGAGSLLPPVYGEAWAKGHATGTPDSTFPGTGRRTRQTCGSDSKPVLTLRNN
ncbi:hypothetical protein TNCV_723001 [Trichonephila clavipes]|nr:hypothetical protein TNCV_723001 [Trichonephila clavipes]